MSKDSKLLTLNPFIDDQGLLRISGRLVNSDLSFDRKNKILRDKAHHTRFSLKKMSWRSLVDFSNHQREILDY